VVPLPPAISLNMSMTLAPIDLWISGDGSTESAIFIYYLYDKHFASAGRLIHHCRMQHRPTEGPDALDTSTTDDGGGFNGPDDSSRNFWDSRRFECRECNKAFRTHEDRRIHETRRHFNEPSFFCEEDGCEMRFRTSWELTRHKTYHSGERPFGCRKGCEKTFKMEGARTRHEKEVHGNERPYKCEVCKKSFTNRGALNVHERTHSDERPYKCHAEGCEKDFRTSSGLSAHRRTHSDVRPHKCDAEGCEKSFRMASELRKHQRIHNR
jgi:KRAB domain-containing zinc finger protein